MRVNDAVSYGVSIVPAAGPFVWMVRSVRHVPPGENGRNHHVYVNVFGKDGTDLRRLSPTVQVKWGWDGQQPDEPSTPKQLEKPIGEDATNIPMDCDQCVWCEVLSSDGTPSDRIVGLHPKHPDEGDDVRMCHHSFIVDFQLAAPSAVVQPASGDSLLSRLVDIRERLDMLIDEAAHAGGVG